MGSIPFEISPIDNSQKQDLSLLFSNFSNKLTDNNASLSKVLGRYQRIGKNQVYDVIAEAKKQQFQTRRKIVYHKFNVKYSCLNQFMIDFHICRKHK